MPGEGERRRVARYHDESTHHPGRFAPGPGFLDWANQPDPFRSYAGAPVLELPLADEAESPFWDALRHPGTVHPRPLDRASLGAFLELSLGLTAWKEYGGSRWALRANPSSGNLHPTEGYVLVPEAPGVPAGLYHYLSRDHVLERRSTPSPDGVRALARLLPQGAFVFGLASIHWREAWKYGVRAFRYCQHDAGHALACARYAAAVLGWSARLLEAPGDEDVERILGLDRGGDFAGLSTPDREHPDALVLVTPPAAIEKGVHRLEGALDEVAALVGDGHWAGRPNALSSEHVPWAEIQEIESATRKPRTTVPGESDRTVGGPLSETPPEPFGDSDRETASTESGSLPPDAVIRAVRLVRQRRSAVAMDGATSVSRAAFFAMMDRLLVRPDAPPWDVVAWSPRVHPILFVHRVNGIAPGLYVLERDPVVHEELRATLRPSFRWTRPDATPSSLPLFLLEEGDARAFARLASCQQEIASESAFSLGMLAAFEEGLGEGSWWYRRLYWEAGVLGQVLYMEAEAAGLRGTGIGCYFDDVVHELLGLEGARFRDLYHFTVGRAVDDPRLATLSAYPAAVRSRTG